VYEKIMHGLGDVINKYPCKCHCKGDNLKQSPRPGLLRGVYSKCIRFAQGKLHKCALNDNGLFTFTIVILLWASASLYAGNAVSYVPQGTVEERLREGIAYAQKSINICIHNFAASDIEKELVAARDRGVRVRIVILEHSPDKERGFMAETLIRNGFDIRVYRSPTGNEQVQDFILLDDRVLVTGVYNWLAYQNRSIGNEVIVSYDQDRIGIYKNTFCTLFAEGEPVPFEDHRMKLSATKNPPVSATLPAEGKPAPPNESLNKGTTTVVAEKSPETVSLGSSEDLLDSSFEEVDRQFGKQSTLSRAEKNKLWKSYKGKYVRWQGIVLYKGMGRVDWNRIGVSRQQGKKAEVEILFDWKMFEKVMGVRIGSTITYSGKLVSRSGIDAPYRLDDGNIE